MLGLCPCHVELNVYQEHGVIERANVPHTARCPAVGGCWLSPVSLRVSWAFPHASCLRVPRWLPPPGTRSLVRQGEAGRPKGCVSWVCPCNQESKAASRRLALTYHGEVVDHMATPSSKRVWGSHSSSRTASIMEVGEFGSDRWSFHNQQCLSHSLKEDGDCQALDKEALGL